MSGRAGRFALAAGWSLATLASTASCFSLRPAETPMATLRLTGEVAESRCLIVLLPGRGDLPADFATAGFAELVGELGLSAEIVAVDSHMGYFRNRSILERLEADVISPARRRGIEEIWWVGVSLGGLASVLVLDEYPEAVDGVVLLAPYLGEGATVDAVLATGDLAVWTPDPSLEAGPDDLWRRLWTVLQRETARPGGGPPVFLGFGDRDRYREAHRLLAGALPDERVHVVPGGHDWSTWSELWSRMTADGLPLCASG